MPSHKTLYLAMLTLLTIFVFTLLLFAVFIIGALNLSSKHKELETYGGGRIGTVSSVVMSHDAASQIAIGPQSRPLP